MIKTLCVISGKGGVGKSSITASLAVLLAEKKKIIAVDADVDAANLSLILGIKKFRKKHEISTNYKAFVNKNAKNCKKIINVCTFSAISWNKKKNLPEINKFLCEGCGSCKILCPKGIELKKVKNAIVGEAETNYNFSLISGQLKMGESGSGKVVDIIKMKAEKYNAEIMLVDSAPGIGCPVIASIRGSDFIIAVTEPTPAALSDLNRSLQIVEHFGIPYGIIINKYDLNKKFSKKLENLANKAKIPILSKIPYDKDFIRAIVKMKPIVEYNKKYRKTFKEIIRKIKL